MSTKYEQMCEAANRASLNWNVYRDRCGECLGIFMTGFATYCQIPGERLTLLRWNGEYGELADYEAPEDDKKFALPGAMRYDPMSNSWHIGANLRLGSLQFVTLAIQALEQNGRPALKFGLKVYVFSLENPELAVPIYDALAKEIISCYEKSTTPDSRRIGF